MEELKKYIDNALFIKWVFDPDDQVREYWDYYILRYPDEREQLLALKEELELFRISNQKLTQKRKEDLLGKIAGRVSRRRRNVKIVAIGRSLLKYAAFAFLFISVGVVISYLHHNKNGLNEFSKLIEVSQIGDRPTIILPDGSVINIGTRESEIDYTSGEKIVINNDRIVKLPVNKDGKDISAILQSVPYGCKSKIVLGDKSIVWLNAGSRLIYPSSFTGKKREVTLSGEAYFEVEKNVDDPFIVHTADYRIKVLGTKFNIAAYASDDISRAVLVEGSIELKLNAQGWSDEGIVLKPNEMFLYNKKSGKSYVQPVKPDQYICWVDGIIECQNEELSRVIRKLERFYDIQIELKNPQDGSIKIDGKLNLNQNKNEVLYYLTKVAKRQFIKKNDWYYIIE